MRRDVLDTGTATTLTGYTVTVTGLSEDLDAGEACVANRGAVDLHVEGPDGFVLDLHLAGADASMLVRPLVSGAVLQETPADIARRYLRDNSEMMYPYQIESLRKTAGLPYSQMILDEALAAATE
ncbi:hypothetical protein IV500_05835 [Paeniglutamicibacter antarcticus]|uniref:Uncharacterized protein n=1 Tax=Arthrobacter terrae TaxID=2935737 RepID=A0A931G4L6_9MICC|nr:hypothetical protein [Arthrobacter terrae]MBG0738943.1 hypothetical protein [Arthrobacter terrae]